MKMQLVIEILFVVLCLNSYVSYAANVLAQNITVSPCITQNVTYKAAGIPLQNYNLYKIDASAVIRNASINFEITIDSPNNGCTWSLDVYPLDGRIIPWTGRPTGVTVFGLYDQTQGSTVNMPKVNTLQNWSNGTGKFDVGITGAWFASSVGCKGKGVMNICFSSS